MPGPALRRRLMLLVGDRRQFLLITAVVLAAAIPGLATASSSAALQGVGSNAHPLGLADAPTPQGWGGAEATVDPNPAPAGTNRFFYVTASSATDCWDNLGNYGAPNFQFNMVVSSSFTWNVECWPQGGDSEQVVVASNPTGWFDDVNANGTAMGWACDADDVNAQLWIHFYSDGQFRGATIANQYRPDVAPHPACGGNPWHGFHFSVPDDLRNGQSHSLYAYAINVHGGTNVLLGGSPQSFVILRSTVPPSVSASTNPVVPGTVLTSSPGVWSGTPTEVYYEWFRNGAPIPNAVNQSYTVTTADVGAQIRAWVTACVPGDCETALSNIIVPEPPPQPPPGPVTMENAGDYVVFQNQEARYYIGLGCPNKDVSVGSWKPADRHAGPGYISKIVRLVGGQRIVAEPTNAGAGALLQGVGVFGTHMAKRDLSKSIGDQGWAELGVANGNYCWSDPGAPHSLPIVAGVKSWSAVAGPSVQGGDTGVLTVDVVIGNDNADLLSIRYDYRVKPSVVYQWTTVTVLCHNGLCQGGREYYVKEPKMVVTLNGSENDYLRVSCWSSSTSWSTSAAAYNRRNDGSRNYAKWVGNDPAPPAGGTMRCMHGSTPPSDISGSRGRILFDYGVQTPETSATVPEPVSCTNPSSPSAQTCFIATGRGFTPPGGPGTPLTRWEGAPTSNPPNPPPVFNGPAGSFDHWAVKSTGQPRLPANVPNLPNTCSSSMSGPPSNNLNTYPGPDNRRWELYGRYPNELGRNERGGIFKAWEGGPVVADCMQLFARLSAANDRWGAFNAYSFGPGWENMTNP